MAKARENAKKKRRRRIEKATREALLRGPYLEGAGTVGRASQVTAALTHSSQGLRPGTGTFALIRCTRLMRLPVGQ